MPPVTRRPWQGITVQLFFLAILPLGALLLVVTFGTLSLHHTGMRSLVGDRSLRSVRAAAAGLQRELLHQADQIALAARQPNAADPAVVDGVVSPAFDDGAALFSASGDLLHAAAPAAAWAEWLSAERLFLLQDLWENAASEPAFSVATEVPGVGSLAFVAGRTTGGDLLVAAFSPSAVVQRGLADFTGPLAVTVIDRQNRVLYQESALAPGDPLVTGRVTALALQGGAGIEYSDAHDGERVVAYSPVAPLGWVLLVEEPWEAIANPLLRATQYSPLILVPVLLLAMVALWFALRQIVQPLQALGERAEDLAEGDFETIRQPVGGIAEIRQLQDVLAETAAQLQIAQQELHSYIGSLTAGVEQERINLARELHDDTLQMLIALNQRLQLAGMHTSSGGNGQLQEAQQLTQQAALNLRRVVQGLRPIYLEDLGLAAALGMLARQSDAPAGPNVQFQLLGEERRLEPDAELAFYRIAQEALNNALKHAAARQVLITLEYGQATRLTVQDDGKGFELPARSGEYARQGHYGLLGISERADLIGAELEIQSAPSRGTTVTVALEDSARAAPQPKKQRTA